jgi:glycosyltransferase involved in cell wall biosynthesis
VIGVPLYNGGPFVREALDSLVEQRFDDYAVVLLDDCSTDETTDAASGYATREPHVTFERSAHRLGLVESWSAVYRLATTAHPSAEYFAWGSDHDIWDPDWLRVLVDTLDARPEDVLAFPQVDRIDEHGVSLGHDPRAFDASDISDRRERLVRTAERMAAGNLVYGLFRLDALRRCDVLPRVLLPDRLLLGELALHGRFVEVDRVLWRRRYRPEQPASLDRQRELLFVGGAPPSSRLPWFLVHAAVLFQRLVVGGSGRPEVSRWAGVRLAAGYAQGASRKYLREKGESGRGRELRMLRKRVRSFGRRQRHRAAHHGRRLFGRGDS